MKRNIFIIGSKGIPANYGGFETFVENLTLNKINKNIKYNVACIGKINEEKIYNGARCFTVKVPNIGPAKAIYYDLLALKKCIEYIKKENINNAIIYVLACRIGPFIGYYKKKLKKLNCKLYVNPDGHEWLRAKWNGLIKKYWKISEKLMIKHADLIICDSINIEKYINENYNKYNVKTKFIAYGADTKVSSLKDNSKEINEWYKEKQISSGQYYLVVGRFVPENNYKTIINEFIKSNTNKKLVLITNIEKNKFYNKILKETRFDEDSRIKFVGTVYDTELLKKIRENSYAYIHGHSVGGTNPSLLEALASTKLNLLFDVGFNREVGKDGAIYWSTESGKLADVINKCDNLSNDEIEYLNKKSKTIIDDEYSWKSIITKYEETFYEK